MAEMKKLQEGEAISEEKLVELGWKYTINFAYDLKVFVQNNKMLFWDYKKGTIHLILTIKR